MRRIHKALATLALGLALVGATTAAATAATPPTGTRDLAAQHKALYLSELQRNLPAAPAAGVAATRPRFRVLGLLRGRRRQAPNRSTSNP